MGGGEHSNHEEGDEGAETDATVTVVDLMEAAYTTWLAERTDTNYLRSWPTVSPWTDDGAKNRVQIYVSDTCPFAPIHFYRSMAFPDVRKRAVRTLVEKCKNMNDLAVEMTRLYNHSTLRCSTRIIQLRGRSECSDSKYIKYIYKSETVCISTDATDFDDVNELLSSDTFFVH